MEDLDYREVDGVVWHRVNGEWKVVSPMLIRVIRDVVREELRSEFEVLMRDGVRRIVAEVDAERATRRRAA